MKTREIIDKLRMTWRDQTRHSNGHLRPAIVLVGRDVYLSLRLAAYPWNVYALAVVTDGYDQYLTFQGIRIVCVPELSDDYVEMFSALPSGK